MPRALRRDDQAVTDAFSAAPLSSDGTDVQRPAEESTPPAKIIRLTEMEGKIYLDMARLYLRIRHPISTEDAKAIVAKHSKTTQFANLLYGMRVKGAIVQDESRASRLEREPVTENVIIMVGKKIIWPKGAAGTTTEVPAPRSVQTLLEEAKALIGSALSNASEQTVEGADLGKIFEPLLLSRGERRVVTDQLVETGYMLVENDRRGPQGHRYRILPTNASSTRQAVPPPAPTETEIPLVLMPPAPPRMYPSHTQNGVSSELKSRAEARQIHLAELRTSIATERTALDEEFERRRRELDEEYTRKCQHLDARSAKLDENERKLADALKEVMTVTERLHHALTDEI